MRAHRGVSAAPQSALTLASIIMMSTTMDCMLGRAVGSCAHARVITELNGSSNGGSVTCGHSHAAREGA